MAAARSSSGRLHLSAVRREFTRKVICRRVVKASVRLRKSGGHRPFMDWVEEFYAQQHKWSGVYAGGIGDVHRRRVRLMEQWSSPVESSSSVSEERASFEGRAGAAPRRVLELGAGGGQFAAAAADAGYDVTAIELIPSLAQQFGPSRRSVAKAK